ncbi:FtsX-like permease family protein [Cohnella sp. CFH 77786]|uniref:ABC transporter permease n=1 Tax=Cohnella sp. CFH 77786 TaxID=2662265 RepID=UPI001C60B72A|nr:FtsX-like permease family protein [Cohnella sp. CFH 77786]MBW5447748.1 FtsX-like permease family protein [Cohnella sp. CFH 77786]
MNAVWSLCLSYLRKRKVQNGFIALLILLSTLSITTAASIMVNSGNLFSKLHDRTNGSHLLLTLEKGLHDPRAVHDWWASQAGVRASKLLQYRTLSGIVHKGKDIPNLYLYMMNTPAMPFGVDELIFASNNVSRTLPASGTVWIPTSLAYNYGIHVGDILGVKKSSDLLEFRVSEIVVDIPYGAPFSNTSRIWMNPSDYAREFHSMPGNDAYMLGLRFDDYSKSAQYWKQFEQHLGTVYLESKKGYDEIAAFYLIINKLIGFVMIFLGAVMMLVALLTIGFTIYDAILANYATIGVLQAIGLRSRHIVATYLMQYAILAIVAIVPGTLLSEVLSRFLIGVSMSSLKTESTALQVNSAGMAVSVGLVVLAAVILCVLIYAGKARRVIPMQAIRYGMSESEYNKANRIHGSKTKSGFGRFPAFMVIGIRSVITNRKGSLLMLVLAVLTSAVLVFGFVFANSMASMRQTASQWGYDSSDVVATVFNPTSFSRKEFDQALKSDRRIRSFAWSRSISGVIQGETLRDADIGADDQDVTVSSASVVIDILEGSYDEYGFSALSGRNPRNGNEIAIGVNVARKFNKQVGDTVVLYLEGQRKTLLVTGIYQSIANMSNSARITSSAAASETTDEGTNNCFINLYDSLQANAVADQWQEKFKDAVTVVSQQTLLDSVYHEATILLLIPTGLIGLLFLLVTFIIIYSTSRIYIRKLSKTFGIYKSLGMTSGRIRQSITIGNAVLCIFGAVFGIIVGINVLPAILEKVLSSYGIVRFPIVLNGTGTLAVVLISVVNSTLGVWMSSSVIKRTTARILVIE